MTEITYYVEKRAVYGKDEYALYLRWDLAFKNVWCLHSWKKEPSLEEINEVIKIAQRSFEIAQVYFRTEINKALNSSEVCLVHK